MRILPGKNQKRKSQYLFHVPMLIKSHLPASIKQASELFCIFLLFRPLIQAFWNAFQEGN